MTGLRAKLRELYHGYSPGAIRFQPKQDLKLDAMLTKIPTGKKVVVLDPHLEDPVEIDQVKDKILRQRHAVIERAQRARTFGIIIGEKVGQRRLRRARELRKLLRWKRRDAVLIMMDKFDPEKLKSLGFDAYVSTACPRIAIDDVMMYDKPLLTPQELEIVLGVRKWENYVFDQMTEDEQ